MNISLGNSIEPSVPPMLGGGSGSLSDRMQTSSMLPTNQGSGISKQADLSKISSIIGGDSHVSSGFDDLKKIGSGGLLPNLAVKKTTEKVVLKPASATTETLTVPSPAAASSNEVIEKVAPTKKRRPRKKWKKPKDKPNRPLSAYNLFFQQERALMLGNGNNGPPKEETKEAEVEEASEVSGDNNGPAKRRIHRKTHGKVGFAEMARSIGAKWKSLPDSDKEIFVKQASKEKERYAKELALWKEQQKLKEQQQQEMANSIAARNDANQSNGVDAFADSATKQRLALLQDVTRGSTDLSTINILRALQGQQQQQQQQSQQQLGSESNNNNNNNMKTYPNAAEASANAIFQQFQGMLSQQQPQPSQLNPFLLSQQGGMLGGNDMQNPSSLSLAEQLQLNTVAQQRMQLERLQMQQLLLQNQLAMSNVSSQAPGGSNNPSFDMLQQQMNQMNQQFQPNNVGNGNQLNFMNNQQRP